MKSAWYLLLDPINFVSSKAHHDKSEKTGIFYQTNISNDYVQSSVES